MTKFIIPIATFIWCGLIIGIGFLEAPLKFQAPNITLELGLGIGQLVFTALNRVELILAIIITYCLYQVQPPSSIRNAYYIIFALLLIQTLWLLPALNERVDMYLSGQKPPASPLHIYYIVAEAVKLLCLFIGGIRFMKHYFSTE